MAVVWHEKPKSRGSTDNPPSLWMLYSCSGTSSDTVVRAMAQLNTPVQCSGLWRLNVEVEPLGAAVWDVKVSYGPWNAKAPEALDFRWQFDTTGATQKITHGRKHVATYAANGVTPANKGGAINVQEDGSIEGCEIVVPQMKWTETWQMRSSSIVFAYGDILEELTGKVNASTFRGRPEGTVRFDGAVGGGSNKNPDIVELTYHFVSQRHLNNQTFGQIQGVTKRAWDYIWFTTADIMDTTARRTGKKLMQIDVERVYDPGDFSLLGIGTGMLSRYYGNGGR